jgi:superfamily II DNA or RNA helicase
MDYERFLETKKIVHSVVERKVSLGDINEILFPFQRAITRWAVKKGRAAIFADTGLGKTFMQLEWCRLVSDRSLIIAPLNVADQTCREAERLGIDCK